MNYQPSKFFVLTEKDKQIANAQAMNLAVATCGAIDDFNEDWQRGILRRQAWFYEQLTEPYQKLEEEKNKKSRQLEKKERGFEARDFDDDSKGEQIITEDGERL